MSFIKILLYMVQAALAFFLALFTLHHAAAQQTYTTKNKTLHVKVLKELNGQTQVLNTVIQVTDEAMLLQR